MIEFYTAATPNGQKIHIMLEESGLDYEEHWVDIDRGDPRWSTMTGPAARSRSSNRARSFSTSPRRRASFCLRSRTGVGKRYSG
jgi:hypothetical protein